MRDLRDPLPEDPPALLLDSDRLLAGGRSLDLSEGRERRLYRRETVLEVLPPVDLLPFFVDEPVRAEVVE